MKIFTTILHTVITVISALYVLMVVWFMLARLFEERITDAALSYAIGRELAEKDKQHSVEYEHS